MLSAKPQSPATLTESCALLYPSYQNELGLAWISEYIPSSRNPCPGPRREMCQVLFPINSNGNSLGESFNGVIPVVGDAYVSGTLTGGSVTIVVTDDIVITADVRTGTSTRGSAGPWSTYGARHYNYDEDIVNYPPPHFPILLLRKSLQVRTFNPTLPAFARTGFAGAEPAPCLTGGCCHVFIRRGVQSTGGHGRFLGK